jgi:hypothetical protein
MIHHCTHNLLILMPGLQKRWLKTLNYRLGLAAMNDRPDLHGSFILKPN